MPEYEFIDGPLAGQTLASSDPHREGEVLAVEVVDLAQDRVPRFDYYVEAGPAADGLGRLRHASIGAGDRADRAADRGEPITAA